MQKSKLLIGTPARTTHEGIRVYTWGAVWGTEQYLDPDHDSVFEWYRTDGQGRLTTVPYDSLAVIYSHPVGMMYFDTDPTLSGGTAQMISAQKGAIPHLADSERFYISSHLSNYIGMCPVYNKDEFMYLLFHDPRIDACNPGSYTILMCKESITTDQTIYEPYAYYETNNLAVSGTLTSGSLAIDMLMPWIPTNASGTTGSYLQANIFEPGGILYVGPNSLGQSEITAVSGIINSEKVSIDPPLIYNYAQHDPISYQKSSIKKSNTIIAPRPDNSDVSIAGETTESGGRFTETFLSTKGPMQTYTIIETFIPIPWAIPAPYSIRNVPTTFIWQRLQNPSVPLNWDTLIYKLNNVDITSSITKTLIPGGAELFYQPPQAFPLASRVYVDIYVSASPNIVVEFASDTPAGSQYIKIVGDISMFQYGGTVKLGPNPDGQTETFTLAGVSASDEIVLPDKTVNEYAAHDEIIYTYDNYPLNLNYWFDIVDDFYPPTIFNMYPSQDMQNIDIRHWIRFEIQDVGLGIDISSLTFTVNNIVVYPDIYKYSDNWYQVVYTPDQPFYYSSTVSCFATVADLSDRANRSYAVWSFKTGAAETPIVLNPEPGCGAYPVHLNQDIQVDIYGRSGGINLESLVFTVDQKQYFPIIYPKIYRFK